MQINFVGHPVGSTGHALLRNCKAKLDTHKRTGAQLTEPSAFVTARSLALRLDIFIELLHLCQGFSLGGQRIAHAVAGSFTFDRDNIRKVKKRKITFCDSCAALSGDMDENMASNEHT